MPPGKRWHFDLSLGGLRGIVVIRAEQELKNKQGKPLGPIKDVIGAQARESVKIQTDHALQVLRYLICNSDAGRSKLLSSSASCDLCKSPISILQKKAIGELYRVIPFSSCAFNVRGSYAHFPYKLPLDKSVNALRLY